MKIPSSVSVMGRKYEIVISPTPCPTDAPDSFPTMAETLGSQGKIFLYPVLMKQRSDYIAQILVHEICHAAFGEIGLDDIFHTIHPHFDETVVNSVAIVLTPILEELVKVKSGRK